MIGRKVKYWTGQEGTVTAWEPLGTSMCDVRVQHNDGSVCWYGSAAPYLKPTDGLGPLPDREEARAAAKKIQKEQLEAIRAKLVEEWHTPWPGMEFGKVHLGKMLDGALKDL